MYGVSVFEIMKVNKYSKKAKNIFYYASDCLRQDMYEDFEENPELTEAEFIQKYRKIVYSFNFNKLGIK